MGKRFVAAIVIVLITVSYLVYAAVGGTAKKVVTVLELTTGMERKNVRLGARVADREIEQLDFTAGSVGFSGGSDSGKRGIKFYVHDIVKTAQSPGSSDKNTAAAAIENAPVIAIEYHQSMPESLKIGRDVIVEGDYKPSNSGNDENSPKGVFLASSLVTQCPSKYVPPVPSADTKPAEEALGGISESKYAAGEE